MLRTAGDVSLFRPKFAYAYLTRRRVFDAYSTPDAVRVYRARHVSNDKNTVGAGRKRAFVFYFNYAAEPNAATVILRWDDCTTSKTQSDAAGASTTV